VAEPKDRERAEVIIMAWPENIGLAGLIAQALADERARAAALVRAPAWATCGKHALYDEDTGCGACSWINNRNELVAAAIEQGETP
jgi:hypothetical protein